MSSCNIQYINELPTSQEEKDRLHALHIDLAKKLYRKRLENSGYSDQLFKYTGSRLFVPGQELYYNEAQKFIKTLNDELNFTAVRLVQDNNNPLRSYVSIDTRPDQTVELTEESNASLQTFYKNYFGETALLTEDFELEDAVSNHAEVFKQLTDSVYEKASVYLNTSSNNAENPTARNLRMILGSLKDKSTYGIIESLNKYVTTASYSLNNLNKRLSIIDEKINNLSTDPTTRKTQLKQVSDFVRYSSYYYHLFDTLGDISHELSVLGVKERVIDRYERDLLCS